MIRALLLDADGVLQRTGPAFQTLFQRLRLRDDKEALLRALAEAEQPCLYGRGDFAEALEGVLARWENCSTSVAELMDAWHDIAVDAGVLQVVDAVRASGVVCCIASNQQAYRAAHMSQVLGYARLFDREFYSHALGVAKPEEQYFRAILDTLLLAPEEVLFFDDNAPNVEAAARTGMRAEHVPPHSGGAFLAARLQVHGVLPAGVPQLRP